MSTAIELLARQVQELEAMTSIYGEEDVHVDAAPFRCAREFLESGRDESRCPLLSCNVRVGGDVWLQIVLPERYPEDAPLCFLGGECEVAATRVAEALAEAGQDMECLLGVVQAASGALAERDEDVAAVAAAEVAEAAAEAEDLALLAQQLLCLEQGEHREGTEPPQVLGRRCCYSHHIIAPSKREAVMKWALALGLAGLSKIGWPGVIIVEGPESACIAYAARLFQHRRHPPGPDLSAQRTTCLRCQVRGIAPTPALEALRGARRGAVPLPSRRLARLVAAASPRVPRVRRRRHGRDGRGVPQVRPRGAVPGVPAQRRSGRGRRRRQSPSHMQREWSSGGG